MKEEAPLFDKIYSCYYQVVNRILNEAQKAPITRKKIEELCRMFGYQESALTIVPKLVKGEWNLLKKISENSDKKETYCSLIKHQEKLPLTVLQKRWLKALLADERIHLFLEEKEYEILMESLSGIEPLFHAEDFHYFDRDSDGDFYQSREYQKYFHEILEALEKKCALFIDYQEKTGTVLTCEMVPYQFQYSSKDDKFNLCGLAQNGGSFRKNVIIHMHQILACRLSKTPVPTKLTFPKFQPFQRALEPVRIAISGERNSLERCMLHFANYERHTEYDRECGKWFCDIYYDSFDEPELLLDILSFGPVIKVVEPKRVLNMVKERVRQQHALFYDEIFLE